VLTGRDTLHWYNKPISKISKRDVLDVIESIDQRGSPGASKRTVVYLRRFFNWCAERELIEIAPTDRIRPPHPGVTRDRVLAEDELRYLLRALESEGTSPPSPWARLPSSRGAAQWVKPELRGARAPFVAW
jgi:site-specific recombinase XerD